MSTDAQESNTVFSLGEAGWLSSAESAAQSLKPVKYLSGQHLVPLY